MNIPFRMATIYYNKIIPVKETRFPWLHKNFSGLPGWKQGFIQKLEERAGLDEDERGHDKILFKAFGRLIMLDSSRAELWRMPKIKLSDTTFKVGWLYWAIVILRGQIYFIPQQVEDDYKFLSNPETLKRVIWIGMSENEPSLAMDAMDIMLKLDYSSFRIQFRVISKTGDRIQYTVTYPRVRVIVNSVNGMQNHVISAKYRQILSTENIEDRKHKLLHKDNMTPDQLEWLAEVD